MALFGQMLCQKSQEKKRSSAYVLGLIQKLLPNVKYFRIQDFYSDRSVPYSKSRCLDSVIQTHFELSGPQAHPPPGDEGARLGGRPPRV